MRAESILEAVGLEIRYGPAEAVRGISFSLKAGEVVGLIGPDGAGKTSTLRVLAGLRKADDGQALSLGSDSWKNRRDLHRKLGYLAQGFALYADLTVDENIQFFAQMYGVPAWKDRRNELLDLVDLKEFRARLAGRLSGGMKQKLALACTLIHQPEVLLLDEPTTGVDPVTRREFWRLLAELVARGLSLLLATPYLDEAERCTRVLLMHEGSILADAPPAEIPALMPGVIVEVEARPRNTAAGLLRGLPAVADLSVFGTRLHVHLLSDADPIGLIRGALENHEIDLLSLGIISPGLEDTFLYLTRSSPLSDPKEAI